MPGLSKLTIRLMFHRDLSAVLDIEARKAAGRWSRADFRPVFQAPDTDGWIAEVDDKVAGYVVFTVAPSDAGKDITLLNLAVAPYWRRSGVGRALLHKLDGKLRSSGGCIHAVVPETNLPLQLLLRGAGYRATRILRGHFDDEDGYLMQRGIDARPS